MIQASIISCLLMRNYLLFRSLLLRDSTVLAFLEPNYVSGTNCFLEPIAYPELIAILELIVILEVMVCLELEK